MRITNHKVGDMVKDHFDRIWIVIAEKRNRDGYQYSINAQFVSGDKPYRENEWTFADDFERIS